MYSLYFTVLLDNVCVYILLIKFILIIYTLNLSHPLTLINICQNLRLKLCWQNGVNMYQREMTCHMGLNFYASYPLHSASSFFFIGRSSIIYWSMNITWFTRDWLTSQCPIAGDMSTLLGSRLITTAWPARTGLRHIGEDRLLRPVSASIGSGGGGGRLIGRGQLRLRRFL